MRDLLDSTFDELFPILRSITGPGYEASLDIIGRHIPFDKIATPSGIRVFDWTVPKRWNCRSAVLTGPDGRTIADIRDSSLHVLNFSAPIDAELTLEELEPHLWSLPSLPDAVPYVTSYYEPRWGFCISDTARRSLAPGVYRAVIDSSFDDGGVVVGESVLEGELQQEIVLTSYICHPSLANNELSGPLSLMGLYIRIAKWPRRRFTYRFVLGPETIGSLCWLHHHCSDARELDIDIASGIVLTCTGGPSTSLSYKQSRRGDALVDRLARYRSAAPYERGGPTIDGLKIRRFDPASGSDERQFCSPGFDLPFGQIARTVYGTYPGYHNSLDTKELMSIDSVLESIEWTDRFLRELDASGVYENTAPYGEPQLGRRGLYPTTNSALSRSQSSDAVRDGRRQLDAMLWALNLCDGSIGLVEAAERSGLGLGNLIDVSSKLEEVGLFRYAGRERKR